MPEQQSLFQTSTASHHYYQVYGLVVCSDIVLDAISAKEAIPAAQVDLFIRLTNFPPQPVAQMQPLSPFCLATPEHVVYEHAESATFYVHQGRFIDVMPKPNGCFATLKLVLQGYMLNIALTQRQQLVLHGTTVALAGRALVICGASGSGKSSLSAALLQADYALVADDLCVINQQQQVELGFADLKIWQESATHLAIDNQQLQPIRPNVTKFSWLGPKRSKQNVPLAAIVILKQADVSVSELKQLNGMHKLMPLVAEIYQPWIGQGLQVKPKQVALIANYLANVPVFVFERPVGKLDITQLRSDADLVSTAFQHAVTGAKFTEAN